MLIGSYSFLVTVFDYIQRILKFIRFSHTVFALPFAAGSMIVAAHGFPRMRIVLLILLAMVFARTAAMALSRVADWEINKENPRTAGRHKLVSKRVGCSLVVFPSAAFVLVSWLSTHSVLRFRRLRWRCLLLLLDQAFYVVHSIFSWVGASSFSVGAWRSKASSPFHPLSWPSGSILVDWIYLIYAIQDYDFDKRKGLG